MKGKPRISRYEPTRYVIIGSHHDTWHQGASKPGIGHSVLMEMTRVFGQMYRHGWKPGELLSEPCAHSTA